MTNFLRIVFNILTGAHAKEKKPGGVLSVSGHINKCTDYAIVSLEGCTLSAIHGSSTLQLKDMKHLLLMSCAKQHRNIFRGLAQSMTWQVIAILAAQGGSTAY